jgi:hypothetical protein
VTPSQHWITLARMDREQIIAEARKQLPDPNTYPHDYCKTAGPVERRGRDVVREEVLFHRVLCGDGERRWYEWELAK